MKIIIIIFLLITSGITSGITQAQAQAYFEPVNLIRNGVTYKTKLTYSAFGNVKSVESSEATITAPNTPILLAPINGSTTVQITDVLRWIDGTGSGGATDSYDIEIAEDAGFVTEAGERTGLLTLEYDASGILVAPFTYYWRVKAVNEGGNSSWSTVWSFTTIE